MRNQDYDNRILKIVNENKFHVKNILNRPENKSLLEYLNSQFNFPSNTKISTKIFWLFNNIKEIPLCKRCNNPVGINCIDYKKNKYRDYCSANCANHSKLRIEKIKKTCLDRYGVSSPAKNQTIREKTIQTCLKKYGVECSFQAASVKDKIKKTNLEKYGVEYSSQSEIVQQNIRKACLEKYGVVNGGAAPEIQEKIRQTVRSHYGVDYAFQSETIKDKIKKKFLKKYGKESMLDTGIPQRMRGIQISRKSFDDFILNNEYDEPLFTFEDYLKRASIDDEFEFKCKKCNKTFKSCHKNGIHRRCPFCYPSLNSGISAEEKEVFSFISNNIDNIAEENTSKIIYPYQIDIYSAKHKIGIEFDGLYWHSDLVNQNNDKHLLKTTLCEEKGIQLIHIFEDEWLYKRPVVESRLKSLFGVYDKTVFARKCEVREVSPSESMKFQEANHIQGAVGAKVHLGLYYENQLISLMTFGKPRFNKKVEWELLRFCNKLGYHVPGGAGKLLRHFERNYNPKSLISYADRRWSRGKLYEALGFKLDHASKPDYWYIKSNGIRIRYNRTFFQKHKLKKLLEKFDANMSEYENMKNNGYARIFDCGNLVFIKEYYESK